MSPKNNQERPPTSAEIAGGGGHTAAQNAARRGKQLAQAVQGSKGTGMGKPGAKDGNGTTNKTRKSGASGNDDGGKTGGKTGGKPAAAKKPSGGGGKQGRDDGGQQEEWADKPREKRIDKALAAAADNRSPAAQVANGDGAKGKAANLATEGIAQAVKWGLAGGNEGAAKAVRATGALIGPTGVLGIVLIAALPSLLPFIVLMLLIVGIVGGSLAIGGAVDSGETTAGGIHPKALQSAKGQTLDELKRAGVHYDVPWTILAAVGESATELGKFSPYDNIDRDPAREGERRPGASRGVDGTIGADGTPSLLGAATLTVGEIKEYWNNTSRGQPQRLQAPIEEIIELYLEESEAEGLRGDFVFAQAIAETGHFTNQDTSLNNFAGIAHYDNAPRGQEFPDPRTGVRAHVQLLKKYAGGNDTPLAYPNVAPRAGAQSATWGGLAGTWASDRGYWSLLSGVYTSMGGNLDGVGNAVSSANTVANTPGASQPRTPNTIIPVVEETAGGKVLVVGDSLCAGPGGQELVRQLEDKLYAVTMNCENGRTMEAGVDVLGQVVTSDTALIIIALGTANIGAYNSETFTAAVDAIIGQANGTPIAFVQTFTTTSDGQTINELLKGKGQDSAAVQSIGVDAGVTPTNRVGENQLNDAGLIQWGRAVAQGADLLAASLGGGVYPSNPDGVDVADFPEVQPAIGGSRDTEGLGPYLIEPSAAKAAGINAQVVTFSEGEMKTGTDFIASELSAIRYRMLREGWNPEDDQDFFWTEAVRRLPIIDPRGATCEVGDIIVAGSDEEKRALVNAEIRYMWKCSLTGQLYTLVGIDKTGDSYTNTLAGADQTDTLIGEAVAVAQTFSQGGVIACDDNAELAGVFPISKETFDKYAKGAGKNRGRCDPAANIQAAALAFRDGEAVTPGTLGETSQALVLSGEGKTFPVNGVNTFTNDYGAARPAGTSPCDCHQGVDIFAERGTPVVAIEDGYVVQSEKVSDGGLVVGLQGDSGWYYYMDHLDELDPNATKGTRVRAGSRLGTVGNTGDAQGTPPHLHIQGHPNGAGSDPVNIYDLLVSLQPGTAAPAPGGAGGIDPAGVGVGTLGDRTTELGQYAPMVGGWWAMPWVLGDAESRAEFLQKGATSKWVPSEQCKQAIDQWLRDETDAAGYTAVCDGRTGQVASLAASRLRAALAQIDDQANPTGATTTLVPLTDTSDLAREKLNAKLAELGASGAVLQGGVDVVIPRFNDQAGGVGVGGGQLAASRASASDYPNLVVELAINLGGLRPGDLRFEEVSDPYVVLQAFNAPRPGGEGLSGVGVLGESIPFAQEFNAAAAEHGIDARMLAAVAWTESAFRDDIVSCSNASSAGALGIMQFLPSTAAGMGVDPCDPASAIPGAARLLKGHYERFGTWELAWAAYNAGGGAVERYNGVPPFKETQNYVVKVAERWEQYKQEFPGGGVYGGGPISAQGFVWPTQGTVTSPFGPRGGGLHQGLDVGAPSGTPIYAVADGTVTFSGWQGGYGNLVLVDHGNGAVTAYAHQSQLASQGGQRVQQGEIIGYVGSTGDSTGPHLHFEVRVNGQRIDPRPYLP